jgi:hypothetical protein
MDLTIRASAPGHALARRSYEKARYTGLPLVRYDHAL